MKSQIVKKLTIKKCKVCKTSFEAFKTTQTICSPDCAVRFIQSKEVKNKVVKIQKEKETTKKRIVRYKSTKWKSKLQEEVQKIARLIDRNLPCLATGFTSPTMHGGHVYAKGGNPQCRFDLHNIHRQSPQSNNYQSDDSKMWDGLKREYGEVYHDFVKSFKSRPIPKYSQDDYHEFYRLACTISKELLENKTHTFNKEFRLHLRNEVNRRLNIYDSIYK